MVRKFYDPIHQIWFFVLINSNNKEVRKLFDKIDPVLPDKMKEPFAEMPEDYFDHNYVGEDAGVLAGVHLFQLSQDYTEGKNSSFHAFIIRFNNDSDFTEPETIGAVAHEAFHCACYLYKLIGANIDVHNDEPVAHYIEWVVSNIMKIASK